jgi:hypothetical protein
VRCLSGIGRDHDVLSLAGATNPKEADHDSPSLFIIILFAAATFYHEDDLDLEPDASTCSGIYHG